MMDRQLLRSLPARIIAACFAVLILLGNCWFVVVLLGWEIPGWVASMSRLAVTGVVGGGIGLLLLVVRRWLRGETGSPAG
jgi:hypothetical protein